jgi:hypothetical protein
MANSKRGTGKKRTSVYESANACRQHHRCLFRPNGNFGPSRFQEQLFVGYTTSSAYERRAASGQTGNEVTDRASKMINAQTSGQLDDCRNKKPYIFGASATSLLNSSGA